MMAAKSAKIKLAGPGFEPGTFLLSNLIQDYEGALPHLS